MPGTEMLGGQHRNAAHKEKKSEVMVGGAMSSDTQKTRFSGVCIKEWRRILMLASTQKR